MEWLTLDAAIVKVMKTKRLKSFGAHVFFYPEKNRFYIARDSKNGEYAGRRIARNFEHYHGFIKDVKLKANPCSNRAGARLSLYEVIDELSAILKERSLHSFFTSPTCIVAKTIAESRSDGKCK